MPVMPVMPAGMVILKPVIKLLLLVQHYQSNTTMRYVGEDDMDHSEKPI
jgi:hypothetical protein